MLGPVLIGALVVLLWLDEAVTGLSVPPALAWIPGVGPTVGPGWIILLAGLVVVPLAARELGRIFHAGGVQASRRWMAIAAMAGLIVCALVPAKAHPVTAVAMLSTVAAGILVGSLLWHIRHKDLHGATAAAGAAVFAFVYLGLMFGFVLALRREHSAWVVLGVLAVAKSCDIGAYFTGRALGRHKLIPWVSPGKTWEGLFGGCATSALVAVGFVALGREHVGAESPVATMSLWVAAGVGGLLALVAQAGDLLASVLKRDAGIKDSGRSLPGFGGVLDVIDSILLVAPVAYWVLAVLGE